MRKTEHCALKLTIFIIEHKLSWATAHFVRCNGIIPSITPDEVGSSPRKLVLNNKNSQLQCTMFCFSHFI